MNYRIFRTEIPGAPLLAPTFIVVEAKIDRDEVEAHIRAAAGYVPGLKVEPIGGLYLDAMDANREAYRLAEQAGRTFAPYLPPVVEKIEWRAHLTPYMIDGIFAERAGA